MRNTLTFFFLFSVFQFSLFSQNTTDAVVAMTAEVNPATPSVTINWELANETANILVFRREKDSTSWFILLDTVGTDQTSLTDPFVEVGRTYEYGIVREFTTWTTFTAFGYMSVAVEGEMTESRGKILVFVEEALQTPLLSELERFERDLIGDGWQPIFHFMSETATVGDVKNQIVSDYNADPDNVKQVFLLGEIPVPYSGNTNWDAHPDHQGAWVADTYYGDVDGIWTDNTVNNTSPARAANDNIPGDGKFDQSVVPSSSELAVGRVDFSNMDENTFNATHTELYRRYLDKNHNWRTKKYTVSNQALIDDNFGYFQGEAFAANGYRNFYPLVGKDNTIEADFFNDTDDESYLFGYACGGGSYVSAGGVGNSTNFANDSVNIAFSMIFGSYHGDWDSENNPFMMSALASRGGILSCSWAGRPHWFYQYFASGETLGYCTVETQNTCDNPGLVNYYGACGAHVTLLGDPSLRAHVVAPVSNVAFSAGCSSVQISWAASTAPGVMGYHVYRADAQNGDYTRLTTDAITDTNFEDFSPLTGNNHYMVRTLVLEETPSGSYYNMSTGVISNVDFMGGGVAPSLDVTSENITCLNSQANVSATSDAMNPSYDWEGPNGFSQTGATISVIEAGEYSVTVTDQTTGCSAVESVEVMALTNLPEANPEVSGQITCDVTSVSVTANPDGNNYNYEWTGAGGFSSTDENITVNMPGTYSVLISNPDNGCTSSFSAVVSEDTAPPQAEAGTPGILNCNVGIINLSGSASGGANLTYQWTTSDGNVLSGTNTPNPEVNACGTYQLTVTNEDNGCTHTDEVEVTCDFTFADISITGNTEILCNSPAHLIPVSDISDVQISWEGPGITDPNITEPTVSEPGLYSVTVVNNANGCVSTANVLVTINTEIPQSNPEAGGMITCIQSMVQLIANPTSGGLNFNWSGPNGFMSSTENPIVSASGNYTLTVTNPNSGCSSSASVTVESNTETPEANPEAGGMITCIQNIVQLTANPTSGGLNFNWSGPNGFMSSTENPTVSESGNYTLIITNPNTGCSGSASVTVESNMEIPQTDPVPNAELSCIQTLVQITANPNMDGYTFQWWGPNNFSSIAENIIVSQPGEYTVEATNPLTGCIGTNTVTVVDNTAPPTVDAGSEPTLDCNIFEVILDGTGSSMGAEFEYMWTTVNGNIVSGHTTQTPTVDECGTYVLTVTNSMTGCSAEDVVEVTCDFALPDLAIMGEPVIPCEGSSVTLEAVSSVPNAIFVWSGPGITEPDNPVQEITLPGTYTVSVLNPDNGCMESTSIEVEKNPDMSVSFSSTIDCQGFTDPVISVLGGVPPYTFEVSPPTPWAPNTDYTMIITDLVGCQETISGTTPDFTPMTTDISHSDETVSGANDGTATANIQNGSAPFVYEWSNGEMTQTIEDLPPGTYSVTVTGSDGCEATAEVEVLPGMVGTDNIEGLESLILSPNPTVGRFEINLILDNPKTVFVEITDVTGRILQRSNPKNAENQTFEFDLSQQASGMYFCKIWIENEFVVRRILKE